MVWLDDGPKVSWTKAEKLPEHVGETSSVQEAHSAVKPEPP